MLTSQPGPIAVFSKSCSHIGMEYAVSGPKDVLQCGTSFCVTGGVKFNGFTLTLEGISKHAPKSLRDVKLTPETSLSFSLALLSACISPRLSAC